MFGEHSLRNLFQVISMSCCPAGAGIKAQVCSVVELLVTTLFQAYAVFYLPPGGGPRSGDGPLSCGLLFSILENVTSSTPSGKHSPPPPPSAPPEPSPVCCVTFLVFAHE